ncbi:hypothetical protein Q7C36_013880 [Tachysurus vachellii]|uniref:Uncharacterized protein n=1 Tax=Tachysurus vachellii TaxID=175792 RepID=A0AA88MM47_TACVA|nr:hypothetical protein Q7C36_013880 [Tachysurus vachellii]
MQKKKKKHKKKNEDSSDEEDEAKKKETLKKALSAEEQRLKQVAEMMQLDERKRPYNSLMEVREPTEEEMEAFRSVPDPTTPWRPSLISDPERSWTFSFPFFLCYIFSV